MFGKQIPPGVVILGSLAFLAGFWRLLTSCYALWWSARLILFRGGFNDAGVAASLGFDLLCLGMFGLLLAIAWLAVADALINLQAWAWQVAVILAGLSILFALLEMVVAVLDQGRVDFPWSSVVSATINGLVAWYLFRSNVRDAFNLPPGGEEEKPAAATGGA
ncbi:MAG: hypothetical protein Kow00120_13400 [Anaerolineae bacterium]